MRLTHISQLILIIALLVCLSMNKRVFLDYSEDTQAIEIAKFFLYDDNGYYVDIGAFDPIYISNTLDLYSKGWKGISVEANAERFRRFMFVKPDETKLHYAIANETKIVKLYQNKYETTSTTDEALQEEMRKNQNIQDQPLVYQQVAGLTMAQLCQRYFIAAPNLLNLDVQGLSTVALMGNNWTNPLCRPEIILSEFNMFDEFVNKKGNLKPPQEIMKEQNYTFFKKVTGPNGYTINQIYIANEKFEFYKNKYEQYDREFQENYEQVKLIDVRQQIYRGLNLQGGHGGFNLDIDPFYFHFCIQSEAVMLTSIIKFSKKISKNKDRPIFLFNFNPDKSEIILKQEDYTKTVVKIQNRYYLKIEFNWRESHHVFYVFDHKIAKLEDIKIVSTRKNQTQTIIKQGPIKCPEVVKTPQNDHLTREVPSATIVKSQDYNETLNDISRGLWAIFTANLGIFAIYVYNIYTRKRNTGLRLQSGEEIDNSK